MASHLSHVSLRRNWEAFWAGRVTPLHKRDVPEFYAEHAADLRLLFSHASPRSVLELGCGNGAMYSLLGFDKVAYKGVDFSYSMLGEFAAKHPEVELECANIAHFSDGRQYDLIFMEAVTQYCRQADLSSVFRGMRSLMHTGTLFICSSIPLKAARAEFLTGGFGQGAKPNLLTIARGHIVASLPWPDSMGYWYSLREVSNIASSYGMHAEFYGCHSYPYRFHAVMKLA